MPSGVGAYRHSVGIWEFTIENLVCPQHDNHFTVAHVGNVVAPAGHRLYDCWRVAIGEQLVELTRGNVAEAEASLAPDNQKLFCLGVMVMPAPSNTRVRSEIRKLARVLGFQHLHENASSISMLGNFIRKVGRRQVAEVG